MSQTVGAQPVFTPEVGKYYLGLSLDQKPSWIAYCDVLTVESPHSVYYWLSTKASGTVLGDYRGYHVQEITQAKFEMLLDLRPLLS